MEKEKEVSALETMYMTFKELHLWCNYEVAHGNDDIVDKLENIISPLETFFVQDVFGFDEYNDEAYEKIRELMEIDIMPSRVFEIMKELKKRQDKEYKHEAH